jgi:hypothetical protein
MEIGTVLKIVSSPRPRSLLRNGGVPLSYVEPESSAIRICGDGWKTTIHLKGFDSPNKFFALKYGIKAISFAIAHESIHQVLYNLEGERVSLRLDRISGGGEIV